MTVRFEMTATRDGVSWEINVKSSQISDPFTFYVYAETETEALNVAEKLLREHLEARRP